jgi:hypothetical protein
VSLIPSFFWVNIVLGNCTRRSKEAWEALAFLSKENTCAHPTPGGKYEHILPLSRITNQQKHLYYRAACAEQAAIRFSRQSRICMTLTNEPEPRPGHFSRLPHPFIITYDGRRIVPHSPPSTPFFPHPSPFPKTADKRRGRVYSSQTSRKATQPWPGTKRSTSPIASLHTTPWPGRCGSRAFFFATFDEECQVCDVHVENKIPSTEFVRYVVPVGYSVYVRDGSVRFEVKG